MKRNPNHIALDPVGDAWLSTVLLPEPAIDYGHRGLYHYYESMVFGGPFDGSERRYHTHAEAVEGHACMLAALREDRNPEET